MAGLEAEFVAAEAFERPVMAVGYPMVGGETAETTADYALLEEVFPPRQSASCWHHTHTLPKPSGGLQPLVNGPTRVARSASQVFPPNLLSHFLPAMAGGERELTC
jgi:hypothetical protein